ETLSGLGSGGHPQFRAALERGHRELAAEHSLPGLEFQLVNQIVSLHAKLRVLRKLYAQIQIAGRSSVRALPSLPGKANALAFVDSRGDADVVSFRFRVGRTAKGDVPLRPVQRFF